MSPLILLSLLLQVCCCVHVVRSGRPLYWIVVLLTLSYLAVLVYVIAAVIPDLRARGSGARIAHTVRTRLDPGRHMRQASQQLDVADTPDNRRRLAMEYLRSGDFAAAEQAYRGVLKGIYASDPDLMLGLAQAQHGLERPTEALQTLAALAQANRSYRSHDADLLRACLLAATGSTEEALQRFQTLARSYPGEEARVRFGLLLRQAGHSERAAEQFRDSITRAQAAPAYYRSEQKPWLAIAKRELSALGS